MNTPQSIRYLSGEALAGLGITVDDMVDRIVQLFEAQAREEVWNAPKAVIQPPDDRYMMATLSVASAPNLLTVKTVILNPDNPGHGLPLINGLIVALDGETGVPVAVMDANWITAVRTAALSATAARSLARPDSAVAAFIGAGVQAQSHLRAYAAIFPLERIRILGRGRPNIDALCRTAEELGLGADVVETGRQVVEDADLLVSSTTTSSALRAFLDARWLKAGSYTSITDFAVPWHQEGMCGFDRIVIDDVAQEATMPKKLADPALVSGDLAGLVLGRVSGRRSESERTAFIFRAHPLGDLALTTLAWERAAGSGTVLGE